MAKQVAKQTAKHKEKITFVRSLISLIAESLKKSNHWKLFSIYQAKPRPNRSEGSHNKSAHALQSFIASLDLVNTTVNTLDSFGITFRFLAVLAE